VLARLTGAAYFRQLVGEFQRSHPSSSGNLFHAGAALPAFLDDYFADTDYAWFADVARLERACQEVLVAADSQPLDLQRLASVPAAHHARLAFRLDPALRLFSSPRAIVTVWEAHQQPGDPQALDIHQGAEQAAIQRRGEEVRVLRLTPAEHAALAVLQAGDLLVAACDAAVQLDPAFDLPTALLRWTQQRFLVDFVLETQEVIP
jgi:uncharacterized protein